MKVVQPLQHYNAVKSLTVTIHVTFGREIVEENA